MPRSVVSAAVAVLALVPCGQRSYPPPARIGAPPATCTRNSGLVLPEGFCAVVVAQGLGRVRQVTVSPAGDVFVSLNGGGSIVALRDTDGDGEADVKARFGPDGGTGILWHDGWLWFAPNDRVLRWRLPSGELEPRGDPEVVVEGLPPNGHSAKTMALLGGDTLIVNIGSSTNSCQRDDRANHSPGRDPCPELAYRAGLWRFSAARPRQRQADGTRYATGLRNAEALAVQPGTGALFAAMHGRDQLGQNWGFSDQQSAELPAEEFMRVAAGDDFGWPYCYYDQQQGKNVLAPEYGGDGREVGRCADKQAPLIGFPGHWAPMALAFYDATQFGPHYQGGVFLAFHGSWNRAPLPQEGYRVVFAPFAGGKPTGQYETFATSSEGPTSLRASGVAVGPDGSLYIAGENTGTIWRVMAQR
jgi:glucose/arabinose dehydrogenase